MLTLPLNSGKPQVLYVDDEPDNLHSFKALFRRDYEVHLAETAQEALRILRSEAIHVLVTDQRMPEMTGTVLLEQVATEFPDVLRYMLTGYSDYDPLVDAINKGRVQGYFSKPLNPREFMERVHKGLESALLKERNRRLLAELEDSHAKLRQAHQLARIGVWSWNRKTDAVSWSEELYRLTGLEPTQAPPSMAGFSAYFEAESWASLEEAMDRALSEGAPYELELAVRRTDKSGGWVHAFGGPTSDSSGAITGLHGMIQDITEEKKAQEELRRAIDKANAANTAKSQFLANMSHEIRTPLNGVLGIFQLFQTTDLNEEQNSYVKVGIRSTMRLTTLLSDILDLARIEAGKMSVQESRFEISSLQRTVLELFHMTAKEKGLDIEFILDERLPDVLVGDEGKVRQILFNLVGNAIKFTEKGGVRIEAYPLSSMRDACFRVLFIVRDDGIGISDDQLKVIFEPFVQGEESFIRRYQGAGLGLSIVARLIKLLDGELTVESELGTGTSIYVSIPFKMPCARQKGAHGKEGFIPPRNHEKLRILVAEDDAVTRFTIKKLLEHAGHSVGVAVDGKDALRVLERSDFDLILMDIQMPEMDGLQATRTIRISDTFKLVRDIPIVAMTAYAKASDREKFLSAGMDDYIAKPVEMEQLNSVVARAMARCR